MALLLRTNQIAGVPLNNVLPSNFAASPTETTVTNTAVVTVVFSRSLPGGVMGVVDAIRVYTGGILTNTSGGAVNFTLAIDYDATVLASNTVSIPTATSNGPVVYNFLMKNVGATNSQRGTSRSFWLGTSSLFSYATAAVDSTVAQNLLVAVQWASALATLSYTHLYTYVEYLKTQ